MNDPLKDFVEQHREDFDHLDAPEFNLEGLKQRLNTSGKEKKVFRLNMVKWLAAAAVLVIIASGILVFNMMPGTLKKQAQVKDNITLPERSAPVKALKETAVASLKQKESRPTIPKAVFKPERAIKPGLADFYEDLSDSSSASTRLAAILAIDKSGLISENAINKLAVTLQHDGNSNVRLAALGIMQKYKNDAHVSNLLVNALNNQQDPMVQLALVNLLGTMENVKIDETLHALVSNPATFNAVKDEAYTILMKENKL